EPFVCYISAPGVTRPPGASRFQRRGRLGGFMVESDKSIKCRDCGEEFVFSAGEQAFYKERGFQHEPTRCRRCRDEKKRQGTGAATGGMMASPVSATTSPREFHEAVCSSCG